MMESLSLSNLPSELKLQVLIALDAQSLCRLTTTSKSFHQLPDELGFWKLFCLKEWCLDASEINGVNVNWKREYRFLQFYKKYVYGNRMKIYPEDSSFVRFEDESHLTFYFYASSSSLTNEAIALQSEHKLYPIPIGDFSIAYYEITVLEFGEEPVVGIGVALPNYYRAMPGWGKDSYGLHADDGCFFNQRPFGLKFSEIWQKGDTVGIGLNFNTNQIFFTRNGQFLGVALSRVRNIHHFHATVGVRSLGNRVSVNFGAKPFEFDIRDYQKRIASEASQKKPWRPYSQHIREFELRVVDMFEEDEDVEPEMVAAQSYYLKTDSEENPSKSQITQSKQKPKRSEKQQTATTTTTETTETGSTTPATTATTTSTTQTPTVDNNSNKSATTSPTTQTKEQNENTEEKKDAENEKLNEDTTENNESDEEDSEVQREDFLSFLEYLYQKIEILQSENTAIAVKEGRQEIKDFFMRTARYLRMNVDEDAPLDRIWTMLRYQLIVLLGSRYYAFLVTDRARNKLPTSAHELLLLDPEEIQLNQDRAVPVFLTNPMYPNDHPTIELLVRRLANLYHLQVPPQITIQDRADVSLIFCYRLFNREQQAKAQRQRVIRQNQFKQERKKREAELKKLIGPETDESIKTRDTEINEEEVNRIVKALNAARLYTMHKYNLYVFARYSKNLRHSEVCDTFLWYHTIDAVEMDPKITLEDNKKRCEEFSWKFLEECDSDIELTKLIFRGLKELVGSQQLTGDDAVLFPVLIGWSDVVREKFSSLEGRRLQLEVYFAEKLRQFEEASLERFKELQIVRRESFQKFLATIKESQTANEDDEDEEASSPRTNNDVDNTATNNRESVMSTDNEQKPKVVQPEYKKDESNQGASVWQQHKGKLIFLSAVTSGAIALGVLFYAFFVKGKK